MNIFANTAVTIAFKLYDAQNKLLEESPEPLVYLHGGHSGIFPKIEEALNDKQVGDSISVTLEPEDAFGEYDADLLRVEPRARFPEGLEVGMQFEGVPGGEEAQDDAHSHIYTVTDITDDTVVVDANHPYAGERVWFRCTVREIRPATRDELKHGHAHGDFGVHAA